MKYFIFATVAITEIVIFFTISIAAIAQETSPLPVFMATKPGMMVSYLDWLPPIKLFNPLVMWSYKIMGQTRTITSSPTQCLWLSNMIES